MRSIASVDLFCTFVSICTHAAEALQVPLLPPFLSSRSQQPQSQDLSRGANFAIVGGTALDVGFFLRRNAASVPPFRSSLRVQIGWFRRLKRSLICNTTTEAAAAGCKDRLANSLFVVGELGSNDYGYILAGGKSIQEAKSFVPEVVKAICRGIEVLYFFRLRSIEFSPQLCVVAEN